MALINYSEENMHSATATSVHDRVSPDFKKVRKLKLIDYHHRHMAAAVKWSIYSSEKT